MQAAASLPTASTVLHQSTESKKDRANISWLDAMKKGAGATQRVMMEKGGVGEHQLFAGLLVRLQIRLPRPATIEQACP